MQGYLSSRVPLLHATANPKQAPRAYTVPVNTAVLRAILCRWADVTIPPLSVSAYSNTFVIGQFKTLSC